MAHYSEKDTALLMEAYRLTLIKEQAPLMSLNQIKSRMELMNEAELKIIDDAMNGIINEFFGGAGNIAKGIGNAFKGAGTSIKNAATGAAGAVGGAVKGAGGALAAGAKQVAGNAANMYDKGQIQSRQTTALKKGLQSIEQLRGFIQQAEQDGVLSGGQNFEDMSITELVDYLNGASEVATGNANTAAESGFTKGLGGAMKSGFQNAQQPAPQA